jgi:septum formation protein
MSPTSQIVYLASKSPRRRELLKQIGVQYELLLIRDQPPARLDIDEAVLPEELPRAYVERIVKVKSDAGMRIMRARRLPVRPILTADTTVALGDEIFGKPANPEEARAMLGKLSGQTHQVLTAVAVTFDFDTHQMLSTSYVTFAPLSEADIKRYLDSGEWKDKAGGYAVQGIAAKFVAKISGSYSGVMGLPLHETTLLLRKAGVLI